MLLGVLWRNHALTCNAALSLSLVEGVGGMKDSKSPGFEFINYLYHRWTPETILFQGELYQETLTERLLTSQACSLIWACLVLALIQ